VKITKEWIRENLCASCTTLMNAILKEGMTPGAMGKLTSVIVGGGLCKGCTRALQRAALESAR
jgi:hypothetical protein